MSWTGNEGAEVDDMTLQQAFGDWYTGRDQGQSMHYSNKSDASQLLSCGSHR